MGTSDVDSPERAGVKAMVREAAEAILLLRGAERLIGERLGVDGVERIMIVSVIRSKVRQAVDEVVLYALADFVPMAFVRVALADSGVVLPEHFGRKDSHGRIRDYRRLDAEPIYNESIALAQAWWPRRPDDVRYVARWNGSLALVESALGKGAKAKDLEFAPTLLDGPDEACPPLEERPTFSDRPWWLSKWIPKPWWKFW